MEKVKIKLKKSILLIKIYLILNNLFFKVFSIIKTLFRPLGKLRILRYLIYAFLPDNKIFQTEINGVKFFINSSDNVNSKKIFVNKKFPQYEIFNNCMKTIEMNALKVEHFYDIGAHYGNIGIPASVEYNFKSVHMYEPNLQNYEILNINSLINNRSNLFTYNYLIGDKEEISKFYIFKNNTAASIISNNEQFINKYIKLNNLEIDDVQSLKQVNFDDVINVVPENSLFWLFCQGEEIGILNSSKILKQKSVICFHYSPLINSKGSSQEELLVKNLNENNYKKIYDLKENHNVSKEISVNTFENLNEKYKSNGSHTILTVI